MRKVASVCLALLMVGVCFPSCAEKPGVKIGLRDPCVEINNTAFRESGSYTEFVVFRNGCPADEDLKAGRTDGAVYRRIVPIDSKLPDVGDLDKVKYGFAALVRNDSCGVVGFGCTAANLEDVREVRIAVCDWSAQTAEGAPTCACNLLNGPGCESPKICEKGSCVKSGECVVDDADVADCPLTVAASGPLPAPADSSAIVSGPGIVATPEGFVVAVRDMSSGGDTGQVRLIGLSDCGAPAVRAAVDLAANKLTCSGGASSDGLGIAFANGAGLAAASLPNCGDGGGVLLMPFDEKGELHAAPSGPRNVAFQKFTMVSPTGAAAQGAAPSDFELVYRIEQGPTTGDIQRVVLSAPPGAAQGPKFKNVPVQNPLGADNIPFAHVVTSSQVRAFVGSIPSTGGADGGTPSQVVIRVGPNASDTLDTKGDVFLPDANWAAATAWDDKAAALVPTASGATWKAAQLAGSTVSEHASGTVGSGVLKSAAMTTLRDNLLIVTATGQGMSVHRITGAMGTLSSSAADSVALASDLGGGILEGFDGDRVAIAAARSRVAVVWVNKSQFASGDVMGGWALLKCAK